MLGVGHHAPRAAPAVERMPEDVGEPARRAALCQALGLCEIFGDCPDQALVAGQPEDVIDGICLAPNPQLVPGKAGVGAQQDLDPRPAGADLVDDPRHLLDGTR